MSHEFLTALGETITNERSFCDLDKKDLAEKAGTSATTITNIERGNDVRISTLIAVCDALQISLPDLIVAADRRIKARPPTP